MENSLLAIPKEKKLKPAFVLALLVHLALLVFLWIGVSWQSETGDTVEAEVWDIKVREAAPRAAGEQSELAAAEQAELQAQEESAPPPPAPAVKEATPEPKVTARPDIALEQEKKKAEKKAAEDRKKAEAKQRADEARAQREEQVRLKKEAEQASRKQKAEAAASQKRAKALRRIAGGGSGGGKGKGSGGGGTRTTGPTGTGGSGTAARSTGPGTADAAYIAKVRTKIKNNTSFNASSAIMGNPPVIYDVELLPDGTLRNIRKRKSSGIPGFDEAVLRAIEKSAPYPKDKTGRVPSRFSVTHKPKD
mgnify:CR=1 FL=1